MAIILRADSGSALSHNQVDTNFTSFFYSASLSGGTLTLFRTGSTALGIARASSSYSLVSDGFWTGSADKISRFGNVVITGSFSQGAAGNIITGVNSHAQGVTTQAIASGSHAEGLQTIASGDYSHTEGYLTQAAGYAAHAEGYSTQATGPWSHAEGRSTIALTTGSHAEGLSTQARGSYSHAEGRVAVASGSYSHAEGQNTLALGAYSHAEGDDAQAIGSFSHAEGNYTIASGIYSHAEGSQTAASDLYSHTEGAITAAEGTGSHAEGVNTIASGSFSHAEGEATVALGYGSHAEGISTVALGNYQHVQGQYNISSSAESAFIIGNGTSDGARSNLIFASGSTFQITGSLNISGSLSLRNGAQGAGYILTSDANGTSTWSPSFAIESIVTTTSITTETTGSAGLSQRGRCVIIDNGGNNINLTVNGSAGFTSTYIKHGSGSVTFVQGSGRTLVPVDGTLALNGNSGSTATVISYSTSDYLRVNNA